MHFWGVFVLLLSLRSNIVNGIDCIQCESKNKDRSCADRSAPSEATPCGTSATHCYVIHNINPAKSRRQSYVRGCTDRNWFCDIKSKEQCVLCSPENGEKVCVPVLEVNPEPDYEADIIATRKPEIEPEWIWCIQCTVWPRRKREYEVPCTENTNPEAATPCKAKKFEQCAVWFEPNTGFFHRGCMEDAALCTYHYGSNKQQCVSCKPSGPGIANACVPKLDLSPPPRPPKRKGIDCIQCDQTMRGNGGVNCTSYSHIKLATPCELAEEKYCYTQISASGRYKRGCTQDRLLCTSGRSPSSMCAICSPKAGRVSCLPQFRNRFPHTTQSSEPHRTRYSPCPVSRRGELTSHGLVTAPNIVTLLVCENFWRFLHSRRNF